MRTKRNHRATSSRDQRIRDFIESYRTTVSGRKIRWDEPGESDENPDVIRHNAFLAQKRKAKKDAQDRLKTKGIVPTKDGAPIFENFESPRASLLQLFMMFQTSYQSNRKMTFSEWMREVALMLDSLV